MELAKIRHKARQEQSAAAQMPESVSLPADVRLPAEELSDELFEQALTPAAPLPGPVLPKSVALPQRSFDPLAVILAGREQDRIARRQLETMTQPEEPQAASEEDYAEYLCFRLGDEEYGVDIMEIKEIIKPRELTEVPRMPDYLDGILSLRGVVVPVFSLRRRLGMPLDYDRSLERIVIVRNGDSLHGLRVDRVTDVLRVPAACREPAPAVLDSQARDFVAGIGRAAGRMLIILDIAGVVATGMGGEL